jgi:hypothetical protein
LLTLKSYMPGLRLKMLYRPVSFELNFFKLLVALSTSLISASGTEPPCESVTSPAIVPDDVFCAKALMEITPDASEPRQRKENKDSRGEASLERMNTRPPFETRK